MDDSSSPSKLKQQQRIRLTNTLFAAAGGVVLSIIVVVGYLTGLSLLPGAAVLTYLWVFWLGNALLLGAIVSGFNLRFKDPALSLLQMYWAMSASIMALMFSSQFDIGIYLLLMLILVFGIFRVSVRQFNYIAAYVVSAILVAHILRRSLLEPQASLVLVLVQWLVFSFCVIILTRLCQAIVTLRNRLRQKNEELQEALEAKQQFMANMSHEIRTPMNGVLGMLDIVLREEIPAKQRRYLQIAQSSASSLLAVINDILDFSKIEAGKLNVHPVAFDLGHFITDILDSFSAKAEAQGVELVVDISAATPAYVHTDPMRLRQILNNLLSNALKFTDRGEVVITVSPMPERDGHLLWQVRDTGIGIEARNLGKLFESFSQVDASASRAYGGAGLGLAICKQLCLLMGGDIWVHSTPGQGSRFEFCLPMNAADAPTAPEEVNCSAIAAKRVLVVEDSATNLLVLQKQMEHVGAVVTPVTSVNAAVEQLNCASEAGGGGFDLAILDAQMPEQNGLDLAQKIREQPGWQHLPLILLSAAMNDDAARCNRLLNCRLLHKPVLPSALYAAAVEVLGRESELAQGSKNEQSRLQKGPSQGARVLLVEDNATNQQVAAVTLAELGCEVTMASNGEQAVQAVADAEGRQQSFDLVLMDCQMPVLDGYQATRRIRALSAAGAAVPIIAITANVMAADKSKCLAAGMNDYIAKPFQLAVLQEVLARWLSEPAPKAAAAPSVAKPLCWDAMALRKLVRKEERMVHLIGSFLHDIDATEKAIADAFRQGDAPEARRLIHGLKGASANLGARALPLLLQQLELKIRSGEQGAFEHESLLELHQHLKELKREMGIYLGRADSGERAIPKA